MTTHTAPARQTAAMRARVATGAALGSGLALVANVVVFVLGNLGAPIRVVTGWAPNGADLRISEVIMTATGFVLVGAAVLWVLERRRFNGFRIWVAVAAGFAVVSILPLLRLDIDSGSKAALALMHIATGTSAVAAQAITRRSHP